MRRPGSSIYARIGICDITTDDTSFDRGINRRHGFLTEYNVGEPAYSVPVPAGLKEVGVLMEPTSVIELGIEEAYRILQLLGVCQPPRCQVVRGCAFQLE